MARTLVIKNANFSANKLTTVTLNIKECTSIVLDNDTMAITSLGNTGTLTATVTPADTTDSIVWTSSNENVATVLNGVVTAVGCGSATITATCGEFSGTCVVTVTHIAALTYSLNRVISVPSGDDKTYFQGGNLSNSAYGYSTVGTKKLYYGSSANGHYPFVIPNGATKIDLYTPGCKAKGYWASSTQSPQSASAQCYAYPTNDFASYDAKGTREVTIPDRTTGTYEDMDAVVFDFSYEDGTIDENVVGAFVITFK